MAIYLLPPFLPVTIVQLGDFSFCGNALISGVPSHFGFYSLLPFFLLGFALLVLAVSQTLKQSVEMYKATKQWQPNKYIHQLMIDGILYFLGYVSPPPSHSFLAVTIMFSHPSYSQIPAQN